MDTHLFYAPPYDGELRLPRVQTIGAIATTALVLGLQSNAFARDIAVEPQSNLGQIAINFSPLTSFFSPSQVQEVEPSPTREIEEEEEEGVIYVRPRLYWDRCPNAQKPPEADLPLGPNEVWGPEWDGKGDPSDAG